jgi:putative amide transporter protein
MLLGVVLLYVGAVLSINGIWLIGTARAASRERAPQAAGGAGASAAAVETHPTFMQGREVAVINVFTAFVGIVAAVTFLVQGNAEEDLGSIRGAGFVLLFAFTYLWVTLNQFLNAGGHSFGWYCLFVAITAIPAGIYTLIDANGNTASIWLGIDWFAWSFLWFLFWVLLTLERPIARFTGYVALIEGIGTSWALAIAILEGKLAF